MIYIKKSNPPSSLTQALTNTTLCYDDLSAEIKSDIKKSLLAEQGYICAYCMQRIGLDTGEAGEKTRSEQITIEHYAAQSSASGFPLDTDYMNMLGVCSGVFQSIKNSNKHVQTCDKHRGNTPLTVNPQDESTISQIKYKTSGEIYSDNSAINNDLNITLNLNSSEAFTKANRREVINYVYKTVQNAGGKSMRILLELKAKYERRNSKGELTPFCGAALYFINKWITEFER